MNIRMNIRLFCTVSLMVTVIMSASIFAMEPAARGERIDTLRSVGLISSISRIEFDKTTGQLVNLVSIGDGAKLIKTTANPAGNIFRIYFGVKPLEELPVGGSYLEAREFKLKRYRFSNANGQPALTLYYSGEKNGVAFGVTLDIVIAKSGAFDLTLQVSNTSKAKQTIMVDFPYLSGVKVSDDPASDLSIFMEYAGCSGVIAWHKQAKRYHYAWSHQFDFVYNKQNTTSVGYLILDKKFGSKRFCKEKSGVMKVQHIPSIELATGRSKTYPTARLMAHTGSWKAIAREYGNWMRANFKTPSQPKWFEETDDYHGIYAPDWTGHTGYRPFKMPAKERLKWFDNLNKTAFLNSETTNLELIGWNNITAKNKTDIYQARPDLGGDKALDKAIARAQKIGRHVYLDMAGSTDFWDMGKPNRTRIYYQAMGRNGQTLGAYPFEKFHPAFGFRQATMCPGLDYWRKTLVKRVKSSMRHGFNGFRLDEQPHLVDCFNPDHHHDNPFNSCQRVAGLYKELREAIDEFDTEKIMMAEAGTDFAVPYLNATANLGTTGYAVTPGRVAFPELYIFPADQLSSFESALNGWMVNNDGAKTQMFKHFLNNRLPAMPWMDRKRFAYDDKIRRVTKWRHLRQQFREALIHGMTSDIDPHCPGDEFWRGTLFKSEHYYLLVGGYPNGTDLPAQRRIKLDYLPKTITTAYEIDVYTLKKQPVKIERTDKGIFVAVNSGFSAVLLPKPSCPPKIEWKRSIDHSQGRGGSISLSLFAPWRKNLHNEKHTITLKLPGLKLKGASKITLPTTVKYVAEADTQPGRYYFIVRSENTLPFKGWFSVK